MNKYEKLGKFIQEQFTGTAFILERIANPSENTPLTTKFYEGQLRQLEKIIDFMKNNKDD